MPVVAAIAAAGPLSFQSLKWTEPGAEHAVLSAWPNSCVVYDAETIQPGSAGEALFHTPTLLGGQAAKAGLSCASCHRNGRDNPHFLLAAVSNGPGTSDVSNSFFSAARGNGRHDPVPIPDLLAPGKISRDPKTRELESSIRNLIVDEFGGQEPSLASVDAIATYIRSIRQCHGSDNSTVAAKLERQIDRIDAAEFGAQMMVEKQDRQGAQLLIAAIRQQLGEISEYYAGPQLASERKALLTASREVQGIGQIEDLEIMGKVIHDWGIRFRSGLAKRLAEQENRSLYNLRLLSKAFPPKEQVKSQP
jgi:hypothetical protein